MQASTDSCKQSPRRGIAVLLLTAASALCIDAAAQSRQVFVNGQRMSDSELASLTRQNCRDIPDGAYWLNLRTGAWGYAGKAQVQGVFGEACGRGVEQVAGANRDGTIGPYATMRRAQEVANTYRQRGLHAVAFHNGDGYYVRVSR